VQLSTDAAVLIRTLLDDAHLPDTAGLRLGTDDATHALEMRLAASPEENDLVLAHAGACVFVSPLAAQRVRGQTLHAQVNGRRAFFVD
jgi:Fe-S cluster assembly iron-binding protein IscA